MEQALKEKIVRAVETLPPDAGIEDAMERLIVIHKIEQGLQQAESGQVVSHEEAKTRMKKWLE